MELMKREGWFSKKKERVIFPIFLMAFPASCWCFMAGRLHQQVTSLLVKRIDSRHKTFVLELGFTLTLSQGTQSEGRVLVSYLKPEKIRNDAGKSPYIYQAMLKYMHIYKLMTDHW